MTRAQIEEMLEGFQKYKNKLKHEQVTFIENAKVADLCEMVLGLTEALEDIVRVNDSEYFGKSIEGTKAEKALAKFGVKE